MPTTNSSLPFIEIEVERYYGDTLDHKEILQVIKDRNQYYSANRTSWVTTENKLKLRLDYNSLEEFKVDYHVMDELLELFIEKVNAHLVDIHQIFDSQLETSSVSEKIGGGSLIYLILKYTTNYKDPMRDSYRNLQWYAETLRENVYIEEIEHGFLHFYQTELDYINVNLDKLNPKEFQQWLKNKKIQCSPEILDEFLVLMKH